MTPETTPALATADVVPTEAVEVPTPAERAHPEAAAFLRRHATAADGIVYTRAADGHGWAVREAVALAAVAELQEALATLTP